MQRLRCTSSSPVICFTHFVSTMSIYVCIMDFLCVATHPFPDPFNVQHGHGTHTHHSRLDYSRLVGLRRRPCHTCNIANSCDSLRFIAPVDHAAVGRAKENFALYFTSTIILCDSKVCARHKTIHFEFNVNSICSAWPQVFNF